MKRPIAAVIAVSLCGLISGDLRAHHGGALYDSARTVTVRGEVTEFKFVFPHTLVYVAVAEPDGRTVSWSGELTTPSRLARGLGGSDTSVPIKWTANTLIPGDVIELSGNPARNGAPSMRIERLVDANGRALIGGVAAEFARGSRSRDPLPAGQGADLRGVWMRSYEHRWQNYALTEELPSMTPWAEARFRQARPTFGPDSVAVADTNDPIYQCLPPGVPRIYMHPVPFEIFQFSDRILIVYEFQHHVRQIFTDGRAPREGLPASWMGESAGRWDGEALVIETAGFNDMTWIDRRGVPHSDQLRVTERIYRESDDRLIVELRVEDPIAFDEPFTARRVFDSIDWALEENVCVDGSFFEEFAEFERAVQEYQDGE
ncbi:MAG TPA: DUF6152 family protein [Gammaproteobacteria bacterium]|nr:DUF6152 family protein [Gammaproteobacteria bacterium]